MMQPLWKTLNNDSFLIKLYIGILVSNKTKQTDDKNNNKLNESPGNYAELGGKGES